jgi:hypothetical protein
LPSWFDKLTMRKITFFILSLSKDESAMLLEPARLAR